MTLEYRSKKYLPRREYIPLVLIVSLAIAGIIAFKLSIDLEASKSLDAVIVDGLSSDIPNNKLIENISFMLEDAGFKVRIIKADNLTIKTYKWILESRFKLIIMRVHGAIIPEYDIVGLFANERYNESLYTKEREKGLVGVGSPYIDPSRRLFVIGPRFIEEYGDLKGSIVMIFSCYSGYGNSLEEAFIKAGSKLYIGWNGPVDALTNDYILQEFLKYLLEYNMTLSDAISESIKSVTFKLNSYYSKVDLGPIPQLIYHPQSMGMKTIYDIIDS